MKFSKKYKLNKDLPKYKKDWTVGWCGSRQLFYPHNIRKYDWEDKNDPDYSLDYTHQGYSIEEIKNIEWFTPISEEVDFIPKFPTKNNIEKFVYLTFETRLVDDVDECRAMNELFNSKMFQNKLYEFVKEEYNSFHNL